MTTLDAALAVRDALDELTMSLAEQLAAEELSQDDLAQILAVLDRAGTHEPGCSQRLGSTLSDLRRALGQGLKYQEKIVVEGIGVLQQTKTSRSYAWTDGRMLAHKVALMTAEDRLPADFDQESGEYLTPPLAVVAGRIADALIECGGLDTRSAGWRSEPLKARKLDPNDYREVSNPGTVGVRWLD